MGRPPSFGFLFSILLILSLLYASSLKMLEVSSFPVDNDKAAISEGYPMKKLNEKQQLLVGTWRHETVEGSDPFLKKIGIGIFLRQVAKVQRPTFKLTYNEETGVWHLFIYSAFKNHDYEFKIGEEYLQTTIDGRHFKCVTTLDENGVQSDHQEATKEEPNNIASIAKRWVDSNDKLHIDEECDGIISKRTFTRVEEHSQ